MSNDLKHELIILVATSISTLTIGITILFVKKKWDMESDKDVGQGGFKSGGEGSKRKGKR